MKKFIALSALTVILSTSTVQASYFTDVPDSHPSGASIEFLYELGVVDGYPDGSFGPDHQLNRAEFAKMVVIVEDGETPQAPKTSCFSDVPLQTWYAPYACRAKELGYMKGDGGAGVYFRPERNLNSAEILAVMARQFEWKVNNPKAGEMWYTPYITMAKMLNVANVANPASFVQRKSFSDIMGRSLAVYAFEAPAFTSDQMYTDLLSYDEIIAEDCSEGEVFDAEQGTCVIDCEANPEACVAQEAVIDDFAEHIETTPREPTSEVDTNVIAGYDVVNDELVPDTSLTRDHPELASINTQKNHERIWALYKELFPAEQRKDIKEFYIFTDGPSNVYASVELSQKDPMKWILSVDIQDSILPDGSLNGQELRETLIHEFTHIMTLRQGQIRLLGNGDAAPIENCPTYDPGEGCALLTSYIAKYYDTFWKSMAAEHPMNKTFDTMEAMDDAVYAFYEKYSKNFVTDYAATNPAEDMAETFTFFVVKDKPSGKTVAEKKILFFWDYPELVALRTYIRNKL